MFQANQNNSVLTVSPPESGFSPRREFVPDNHIASSFALFAIAGSSLVRVSSFPQHITEDLVRAFKVRGILRAIREEKTLGLLEFNLDHKPWASSKNVESERLFVDILTIILQHGYSFVSTIDYGREHDDKVSIAFSKPIAPLDKAGAPAVGRIVPFAVSFPSTTILRVINPPLSSTPAILQSVRSAWPRGVVSERKLSGRCFEFKLKGYRWFQEDTFSTDSLQHILSLLNSLDRHAFSLLASISLSGSRSRVKDLWIFSGPPQEPSPDSASNASNTELAHNQPQRIPMTLYTNFPGANQVSETLHNRVSSLPAPSGQAGSPLAAHARSASAPDASYNHPMNHSLLRKKGSPASGDTPSPVTQSPTGQTSQSSDDDERQRRYRLSVVESVDMTGVGSAALRKDSFRALNDGDRQIALENYDEKFHDSRTIGPEGHYEFDPYQEYDPSLPNDRVKTGDMFYVTPSNDQKVDAVEEERLVVEDTPNSRLPSSPDIPTSGVPLGESKQGSYRDNANPPNDAPVSAYEGGSVVTDNDSTPIMGPGVFRDSAFSSSSTQSFEIPITWTGGLEGEKGRRSSSFSSFSRENGSVSPQPDDSGVKTRRAFKRHSTPLMVPSGWQPTPIEEGPEERFGLHEQAKPDSGEHQRDYIPERRDVDAARFASPTVADSAEATRKSEIAFYETTVPRTTPPKMSPAEQQPIGNGWVLVNIDRQSSASIGQQPNARSRSASASGNLAPNPQSRSSTGRRASTPSTPTKQVSSMSPVAKVIAAADAVSNVPVEPESEEPSRGFLRFFSRTTKVKSRRLMADGRVAKVKTLEAEELEGRKNKRKLSVKQPFRKGPAVSSTT